MRIVARLVSRLTLASSLAFVALLAVAAVQLLQHAGVHVPAIIVAAVLGHGPALMASVFIPVQGQNRDQLNALASPVNADMQAFRAPLYDTQSYVSTVTTTLTFFGAINADKTLSNAKGNGGIMPNNMYFEPIWINLDFLVAATVGGANTQVGILDDIQRLLFGGRGIAILKIGNAQYPEIPISYLHSSGGVTGISAGTLTAPQLFQVGTSGVQDSGYCVYRSFLLSPMLPFSITLNWSAAQTLNTTPMNIRLSMDGNWHLPVS